MSLWHEDPSGFALGAHGARHYWQRGRCDLSNCLLYGHEPDAFGDAVYQGLDNRSVRWLAVTRPELGQSLDKADAPHKKISGNFRKLHWKKCS